MVKDAAWEPSSARPQWKELRSLLLDETSYRTEKVRFRAFGELQTVTVLI